MENNRRSIMRMTLSTVVFSWFNDELCSFNPMGKEWCDLLAPPLRFVSETGDLVTDRTVRTRFPNPHRPPDACPFAER